MYLIHYGIKGQKRGERRFQNIDGTLTEAGKNRYYKKKKTKGYTKAKEGPSEFYNDSIDGPTHLNSSSTMTYHNDSTTITYHKDSYTKVAKSSLKESKKYSKKGGKIAGRYLSVPIKSNGNLAGVRKANRISREMANKYQDKRK